MYTAVIQQHNSELRIDGHVERNNKEVQAKALRTCYFLPHLQSEWHCTALSWSNTICPDKTGV